MTCERDYMSACVGEPVCYCMCVILCSKCVSEKLHVWVGNDVGVSVCLFVRVCSTLHVCA